MPTGAIASLFCTVTSRNAPEHSTKSQKYWWSNEEVFNYWLDSLTHMIVKCDQRTDRLGILRSKKQGNGKSTFTALMSALLSAKYVTFHQSAERVHSRFNVQNVGKLVIFIDDISANSQKETRKLYSLATAHTSILEKKGESPVIVDEFSRIWITSNSAQPLFCTHEDRRQLVFDIAPIHAQDHRFFQKLYAEFKNMDIMKAWFDFLAERNIDNFNPKLDPPTDAKNKTIAACQPVAHRFMTEFFVDNDWATRFVNKRSMISPENVKILKTKQKFRIKINNLFVVFNEWARLHYPNNRRVNRDSFQEQITEIGVECPSKRLRVGSTTSMVCDIKPSVVRKCLQELYPSKDVPIWASEENFADFLEEFSILKNTI